MRAARYSLLQALIFLTLALAALIGLILSSPVPLPVAPILVFAALDFFASVFSIPFLAHSVSLGHLVLVSAMLVLGPAPGGWTAAVGAIAYDLWRIRRAPEMRRPRYLAATLAQNLAMQTASVLTAGLVFQRAGGRFPLTDAASDQLGPLALALLTYVVANNGIFMLFTLMRGARPLELYRRQGVRVILVEATPLIFAPLVAAVYSQLSASIFALFVGLLGAMVIITNRLFSAREILQRRARTLAALNAVGRALSANLRLRSLLQGVYVQVGELMDVRNLYVALTVPGCDEISFPLAIENGEPADYATRPFSNGLTEYVLRARQPLFLRGDVIAKAAELGIEVIGKQSAAWLGVPLLAGEQVLGVLAVQNLEDPSVYDEHDLETLQTVAAQTAIAVANARLYERTDSALERRVRELSAIMTASQDGILLLDPASRVLMVNPALGELLDVDADDLLGASMFEFCLPNGQALLSVLGYSEESYQAELVQVGQKPGTHLSNPFELAQPHRFLLRTLVAVQTERDSVFGWLLILRDVTEERELARMSEDLTSMVVHDLRSPLTGIVGGLEMLETSELGKGQPEQQVLQIMQKSTNRMLEMVRSLLDIRQLEARRMPIDLMALPVPEVIEDILQRMGPNAQSAGVLLEKELEPDLPRVQADLDKLSRVIINLVDNALNHSSSGGKVSLWARRNGDEVLLSVTDVGAGIPADELPYIFDKFRQGKNRKGRRQGYGLGLTFCQLAMEAMGGRIWAESELGQGSAFTIAIPSTPDQVEP